MPVYAVLLASATDAPAQNATDQGFRWTNLVILVVVAAVVWFVLGRLRPAVSRRRRERWEREGLLDQDPRDDPDLRRDQP